MSLDLIFAIVFYLILFLIFLKYREKFTVQGKIFVMYKTKLGLKLMDWFSKRFPRVLNFLSYFSIGIGFVGMVAMFYLLIHGAVKLLLKPDTAPMLSPVLPGIKIAPQLPVLSFWHWIIAILILAVIHEFSHGVYARLNKIRVKSSGFAFLGPILAAFVEPDEKELNKKNKHSQLSVLSAGPFSNIVSAFIFLLIAIFVISPIASAGLEVQGIKIVDIDKNFPINDSGLKAGDTVDRIDGVEISNVSVFVDVLQNIKPGDVIEVESNESVYPVEVGENPENKSKAMLGVSVTHYYQEELSFFHFGMFWILKLVFWLYLLSLGVGLFNLLPLGPVDGGKMFYLGALFFVKNKLKARKIYNFITLVCLLLIAINLMPFAIRLFSWLFGLIMLLV